MFSWTVERKVLIPALAGAVVSLFFIRSGFFIFLFLVPLGILCFRYEPPVAWTALFLAILGNLLLAALMAATRNNPLLLWDILFFSVMAFIFIWINSPPRFFSLNALGIRFFLGSSMGALLLGVIFFRAMASPDFLEYIDAFVNAFISSGDPASPNVVQNALLSDLTGEVVLHTMRSVLLRGGALITCVLLFSFSRQLSLVLSRLGSLRKRPPEKPLSQGGLLGFYVYPGIIWVFSASLFLVVLSRITGMEVPEIILWNILILCATMYLAQGFGIVQFYMGKTGISPLMRLVFTLGFIVLLLSPAINVVLLGALALLGIAENWVPFRASPSKGPPSTPEAGDGGG